MYDFQIADIILFYFLVQLPYSSQAKATSETHRFGPNRHLEHDRGVPGERFERRRRRDQDQPPTTGDSRQQPLRKPLEKTTILFYRPPPPG